jgi:hypothetical protein
VAIGQFVPEGALMGRLAGPSFQVSTTMRFDVRVRVGFLFSPTGGPQVGVLVGYVDLGLVHQLIGLPPPPNPSEMVVYSWRAPMVLSTENTYVREVASEPKPVADPFEDGMTELNLSGSPVDDRGRYTIVGSAQNVEFAAPPELPVPAACADGRGLRGATERHAPNGKRGRAGWRLS